MPGPFVPKNRSVPTSILLPHLVYRDVALAGAWLTRVYGFTEHYRYGDPVSGILMRLGEAYAMITTPREGRNSPAEVGCCTQMLTVFVTDVDAHCARAKTEGATLLEEPHLTVYGERQYAAVDLDGHRWIFSQHARDIHPADWGATALEPAK